MNIYQKPSRNQWSVLQQRNAIHTNNIEEQVRNIITQVETRGDDAIRELTSQIDKVNLTQIDLSTDIPVEIDAKLASAIQTAADNIRKFHEAQKAPVIDIQTMPGVRCLQRSVPIQRVGLYIPGGSAPLFSTVLMLAIPASVAGCNQIVMCTPPPVSPAIIFAARLCGVKTIYQVGGAMAVAAMAYGTQTVPKTDKIFGPGNQWVTCAKQIVSQNQTAIDMPAGPSEVMIIADHSARAEFAAADMLSQAEHGADSQSILLCTDAAFAQRVTQEIDRQKQLLSRATILDKALDNCRIVVLEDMDQMVEFANEYAAEHLILSVENGWEVADRITAAGSVFVGNYSPESVGDYASGTNHTLPTYGWAKSYSGVNLDSFIRKITYQELTAQGLMDISETVTVMACNESLTAHANAVTVRCEELNKV